MSAQEKGFDGWPAEEQQDWIEDCAAQLLQDMPSISGMLRRGKHNRPGNMTS
ncbi:hypothetical protein [uncultured Roseobacter sp.]|uniref:hypothetical protein n=1 Tax=uncultured Roseobacter sp. TaxID=114847 RepID=UPI002605ADD0|nr:hypothetical protein [uncultured Roseobacter sp.]